MSIAHFYQKAAAQDSAARPERPPGEHAYARREGIA
jgi:hypothetical protein